ncbi:putative L-ascorbate oxidase [Helianthus anomalus]
MSKWYRELVRSKPVPNLSNRLVFQYRILTFSGTGSELYHTGKTYRIRVINVGVSTCLNFRIQSHNLLLAEAEGHYTSQQNYSSFDIHVGWSYSFLVNMDQNTSSDFYVVASPRFVNESVWQCFRGVAILSY